MSVRRSNGELLLIAHCHMRNDRRTFKLDRIVQLRRPSEPIPPNSSPAPTDAPVVIPTPRRTGARMYYAPAQPAHTASAEPRASASAASRQIWGHVVASIVTALRVAPKSVRKITLLRKDLGTNR